MNPRLLFLLVVSIIAALVARISGNALDGLFVLLSASLLCQPFARRQSLGVDPAGTHSDGALVWGTQVVTIPTTGGTAYIAEDISIDFDTEVLQSKNENGVVNKEVMIEQPFKGSCTLQLADATTDPPAIGSPFTISPKGGGAALNCKVSKVGQTQGQDSEAKFTIEFRKKLV